MNKYISPTVALPTKDILTEDVLKQLTWYGFSESTTTEQFLTAGFKLLADPSNTKNDGDVLVAELGYTTRWMSETDYANIVMNRQIETITRAKRTLLLAECDWTQVSDTPLSTAKKAEWATYRQALRDISSQSGFPTVNWPQKPN